MASDDEYFEIIESVLRDCFEDECDFVGNTNTADIVRFTIRGEYSSNITQSVEGGSDMSMLEVLQLLAAAAVIAKNAIDIYKSTQPQSQSSATNLNRQKELVLPDKVDEIKKKVGERVKKQ